MAISALLALMMALTSTGCFYIPAGVGSDRSTKVSSNEGITNEGFINETESGGAATEAGEETFGGGAATEAGETTFGVGETAEYRDVRVTLLSVTENEGKDFIEPGEGKVFLICEFEIENRSDEEIAVSSYLSFDAYVDDYSTSLSFTAASVADKPTLDGTVAAGKKMNGIIGYEVPKDWSELEIRFTANVWSEAKFIFTAKSTQG